MASLTDEWVKGNIPASQMSVELEKIRDALKKVAGEGDAIDPLVAGLYKALAALPNLKTGLAGLISGLAKAQGIGAISNAGQSFTTTQQNGISVVRGNLNPGANPVIEKNLADLARESRAMHDAIDAAAAEQERQANEAEGQRDSLLDEQRRTTGGIGALSSAIQGLRGDFQSFGTGNPGEFASSGSGGFLQSSYTVLTAIGEAQKTIDSLNAEQGVLQTNIQYRQLTPEQQADAERRLAEISLQIAKLTYFIAQGPTGNPFQSPGFATGGAFKVGGGGGTDSKMVNFLASPSEHVGVYTPDQWDAMIGGGDAQSDNSTVYNYSQTIQTPEVNSFRQARRQLAMDARRQMGGR